MDSTDQEADQQDAYIQRANFYNEIIGAEVYEYIPFSDVIRNSVIVLLVIIGAVLLLFLFITVSRPLTFIKKVMHEYQETKDAEAVVENLSRVQSRTEIGLLSDEFSALATEMNRYTDEVARLAGEHERVATELKLSAAIQIGMLPKGYTQTIVFSSHLVMPFLFIPTE